MADLNLKTDWTAADYYNASDLNRVGTAVNTIAAQLTEAGYAVTVSPKTDWTPGDKPSVAAMAHYLAQVQAIKDAFYGTGTLPASMAYLTPAAASEIEALLIEVENYYTRMMDAMIWRCGVSRCGGHLL